MRAIVATVLLNQDVGSDLRGAEDAMERLVDGHVLPDAVPIGVLGSISTVFQLAQRQEFGRSP